jgi:DNA-binding transcriptional regulator YiaG
MSSAECFGQAQPPHPNADLSIGAATTSPSPRGRVALLGIAQRQVRVSRAHIPSQRNHCKPLPTNVKTLGDQIKIKRYEKKITLQQLASKMGIRQTTVRGWEHDVERPDANQIEKLKTILGPL